MVVLYNGEYTDYDITQSINWEQILEYTNLRKNYIGQQFGDFEIVVVDYDWGSRKQVNIAQCVKCGEKKTIMNLSNFKRGRGEGLRCKCHFAKKAVPQLSVSDEYKKRVGEVVSGFKLLDYQAGKGFRVECVECGNQKWASGTQALDGRVECKHKKVRDYSDSKYIGKKVASLTVIGREEKNFVFVAIVEKKLLDERVKCFETMDSNPVGAQSVCITRQHCMMAITLALKV